VFAPHAKLRARVTACAAQPVTESAPVTVPVPDPALPAPTRRRASIHWARLLARSYEFRPLTCPRCQRDMRLIAFLTEPSSIRAILAHLGEPATPPALAPRARDPPILEAEGVGTAAFAFDQSPLWDPITPPLYPAVSFDQTLNWPGPDHPTLGDASLLRREGSVSRHAAGNGEVATASRATPSSLTRPRSLKTPNAGHALARRAAPSPPARLRRANTARALAHAPRQKCAFGIPIPPWPCAVRWGIDGEATRQCA
jgi:hypothetical protein